MRDDPVARVATSESARAAEAPLLELSAAVPRAVPPSAGHRFDLRIGREAVGVVGASGSGKSTLARVAAGLGPLASGELSWRGMRTWPGTRRRPVQLVLGGAHDGLPPRQRIVDALTEAPRMHGLISRAQATEYAGLLLNRVGLDPMLMRCYPHAFSRGERGRIALARSLAVKPELIAIDDAFEGLDPTEAAQLANVLLDLRARADLALLLVSRERAWLHHVCDRVLRLEHGRLVEGDERDARATKRAPLDWSGRLTT